MIAIISMLSCIAIMGVGVYAASVNFSVSVENKISVHFSQVDGKIWAKRTGNVIYGTVSGDDGTSAVTLGQDNADGEGYLLIYDRLQEEHSDYKAELEANLREIEEKVNFLTRDNDANDDGTEDITPGTLNITYVFKYEFNVVSQADVNITLTDSSTRFNASDPRQDKVTLTYKYLYSASDPTDSAWASAPVWSNTTNASSENIYTTTLEADSVVANRAETYTIYVLAKLEVKETNSLLDAYALGVYDDYTWQFNLTFTPNLNND